MFDNKKWAERIRMTTLKAGLTGDLKDMQAAMVVQGEAMGAAMDAISEALGGTVAEETLPPQVAALQRFANMLIDIAASKGHSREETQEMADLISQGTELTWTATEERL